MLINKVLIFTSNFPELLDNALIRPGRIDMMICFKKANKKIISGLDEKLRAVQRVKSSLGEEARLMGVIEQLTKQRKVLGKAGLEQNTKDKIAAERKLAKEKEKIKAEIAENSKPAADKKKAPAKKTTKK
jgi:hypothetical protein